jgi:predicted DNA-binding WGR domain protein
MLAHFQNASGAYNQSPATCKLWADDALPETISSEITHFARSPFRLIHSACTVRKSRTKSRRINAVILYRNDRARRMHRYYRLDVQPNLFGEWCLMRERGRIGSSGGQLRSLPFATEQEAEAALAKAATRETKTQLCISPG